MSDPRVHSQAAVSIRSAATRLKKNACQVQYLFAIVYQALRSGELIQTGIVRSGQMRAVVIGTPSQPEKIKHVIV